MRKGPCWQRRHGPSTPLTPLSSSATRRDTYALKARATITDFGRDRPQPQLGDAQNDAETIRFHREPHPEAGFGPAASAEARPHN